MINITVYSLYLPIIVYLGNLPLPWMGEGWGWGQQGGASRVGPQYVPPTAVLGS